MKRTSVTLSAALMLSVSVIAAQAEDLVVFQNWSSPSEVAALNVLKDAVALKGINWIDITIPHDTGSNVTLMNLVAGQQPPNIFIENSADVYRDLSKMGLGLDLTQALTDSGALAHYPEVVRASITVDGEVRKFPLGVHIDGMLYYNLDVAAKAGVDPKAWTSLDQMYADFDKIRAAGFQPLAVGAQQWQIGYLTHALIAAVGGQGVYNKIYGEEPDSSALDSAEVRTAFEWLRKFQQQADEGSVNRDWNMTTNSVIAGQALMQIHGDWMKGEWRAAGKEAGKDFGCLQIPGAMAVPVTVDSWGALGGQSAEKTAAEILFAQTVADAAVNAAFAIVKGATPVRNDAPTEGLDACAMKVLDILKDSSMQVRNPHAMVDADWGNAIWEVAFNYWSDPAMTTDAAVAELHKQFETILE